MGLYVADVVSPALTAAKSEEVSTNDTSRIKVFSWDPIIIPSGRDEWPYSQAVRNLKISIIEQKGAGAGKIITRYAASGTYSNATQDDVTHKPCEWAIYFKDKTGTEIDSFCFVLSHGFCSYPELPFNIQPSDSAFNFFDVIVGARAYGLKPAGYQGGC